jgi:hypothetical protein
MMSRFYRSVLDSLSLEDKMLMRLVLRRLAM